MIEQLQNKSNDFQDNTCNKKALKILQKLSALQFLTVLRSQSRDIMAGAGL